MCFKKETQLSKTVHNDEPLARYIFSKKHFAKDKKRIRRQAFLPPENKNALSVIRYKDCSENEILEIGKQMEKDRSDSLKAYCSVLTKDVRTIDHVEVESDTSENQHKRHAHIKINIPYHKAKIKQIADDLASIASNNGSLKVIS